MSGNFLAATRQNIMALQTRAFDFGTMTQMDLPKVGLLANLFVFVKGVLTRTDGTGAATLKDKMDGKPFNLIRELRVKINSGLTIVKISGYDLYLHNLLTGHPQLPDVTGAALNGGVAGSRAYQFGTAVGANTTLFGLQVPIALTDRDPIGLILLQTSDTVVTLEIDWETPANMFTLTGTAAVTWSGSVYTAMETYSVPGRKEDRPDLGTVHSLISGSNDIVSTGEQVFDFERGNVYLRVIDRIILNDVRAGVADIDSLQIRYNGNQYPYQRLDADVYNWVQRRRYGRDLPQGVFAWDWFTTGNGRDWINSGALTEFQQLVSIASTAALGQNNNKLISTKEILIPVGG